jgi:hypothetical protein
MRKLRKSSVMKTIKKTTDQALPVVNKGLNTVGTTVKDVAKASIPIVEKGVSVVYGTMSTGLDLSVEGVKNVVKGVKKITKKRRSRSLAGGRRTRHRRTRHRKRH